MEGGKADSQSARSKGSIPYLANGRTATLVPIYPLGPIFRQFEPFWTQYSREESYLVLGFQVSLE